MTATHPVLAASAWRDNAALIAACARLGYLEKQWAVLDPTYGKGNWWKRWRPGVLTVRNRKLDGSDFTAMEFPDDSFDAVAYDPPYVCKGGRETSGIKQMDEAYGMHDAPRTPALLTDLILAGLDECWRVLKPRPRGGTGGVCLVKAQDYVWSGHLYLGVHPIRVRALDLGFRIRDELVHVTPAPRPQPERTRKDGVPVRQQHARRNLSIMLVLQKG